MLFLGLALTVNGSIDHNVTVGGSQLIFNPSNISAQAGDTVTFQFMPGNHTATQSTFEQPCQPFKSSSGQGGFDSGFMQSTYTINISDVTPIWVYCKQGLHCREGMVFSINADVAGSETYSAFKARAMGGTVSNGGAGRAVVSCFGVVLGLFILAEGWML